MLESLCGPSSLQFYQKETPTLMFSCEYCENFKNTYFEEHLQTTASNFMKNNRHSWTLYNSSIKILAYRKSGTQDPGTIRGTKDRGPGTQDLSPVTRDPRPIRVTQNPEPIDGTRDPGPSHGTQDLEPSTWDSFWNIHTPMLAICHMKGYMERNNFDLRSNFWKWLLHMLNCVWKVPHKM